MLFLLLLVLASAQTPLCGWQCDDPVCHAVCWPMCSPPACEFIGCSAGSAKPNCRVNCNTTVINAVDMCPLCETHCDPPPAPCTIQCEIPQCGWVCDKPMYNCPKPTCQLQCEQPACAYSVASRLSVIWGTLVLLGVILLIE